MLRIKITNDQQQLNHSHASGPLEIGRGQQREIDRITIEDRYVSRDQLLIEESSPGELQIENLGGLVTLSDGSTIEKGTSLKIPLPVQLVIGYSTVDIASDAKPEKSTEEDESSLQTISRPIHSLDADAPQPSLALLGESPSASRLASWFETLLSVQRSAAGSAVFYEETARAVVDIVGLDRGLVLLRQDDRWELAASHVRNEELGTNYSRTILRMIMKQRRTFFQSPSEAGGAASLIGVEAVVASPIFDENHDQIVGIVYGSRDLRAIAQQRGIQQLEAQVVQLLAGTVSAGLARIAQEAEAARNRVQFERFFSPELARALERNPSMLEGHEREVSVLFSDLRSFSRISENLGLRDTYRLLGDVMDTLTGSIVEYGGVIVDYHGDGLAAMWNAPLDQEDHAIQACLAALDMLNKIPQLNERWLDKIGIPLRIGVGINTGEAQVGNAGSQKRLKYGPRGHAVNLASRIEGATKQLGVPLLIADSTYSLVADKFPTRRLCQVRVVGIQEPVELYEVLCKPQDESWNHLRDVYQQALSFYEEGEWGKTLELIQSLLSDPNTKDDLPTHLLAEHLEDFVDNPPANFDPVFHLDRK